MSRRRAAPPAPGSDARGSATFADSEPRRGPFGPLSVLGPWPPRAGFWAPSSLLLAGWATEWLRR
eukprot:10240587-Alexandrium_andersonii.AAC.1